jgi:hypothetical protein
MTLDECDSIGLSRWKFVFLPVVKAWHEYHYNAICESTETRGFDPYSNDTTRQLGLPLAETESYIPISKDTNFLWCIHCSFLCRWCMPNVAGIEDT